MSGEQSALARLSMFEKRSRIRTGQQDSEEVAELVRCDAREHLWSLALCFLRRIQNVAEDLRLLDDVLWDTEQRVVDLSADDEFRNAKSYHCDSDKPRRPARRSRRTPRRQKAPHGCWSTMAWRMLGLVSVHVLGFVTRKLAELYLILPPRLYGSSLQHILGCTSRNSVDGAVRFVWQRCFHSNRLPQHTWSRGDLQWIVDLPHLDARIAIMRMEDLIWQFKYVV